MARVFFLNPSFYGVKNFVRTARWFARSRGRVGRPPDYYLVAVAVLEKAGHVCKFIDSACKEVPFEKIEQEAKEFKPNMIVVTTTTPSIYNDIEQAAKLKEATGAMAVLIGSHVSVLPEESLKIDKRIDAIAKREYDYTLKDLADVADGKKKLKDVAGITYRDGEKILSTKDRPPIENLDELPFPAWHHIDVKDYFDAGKLYPFLTIIAGRGCPNGCTFCLLPQTLYGRRYRLRSAKNVVDEIEYDLKMFPDLKEIMFEDDTLTADQKRCAEICDEIIKRDLQKKLSFSGNSRADIFDINLLKKMKEANFRMLVVGFEFGDQKVLDAVHKGELVENMKKFSKLAKEVGIKLHGCFMIGGPSETEETASKTIQLAKDLGCDTLQFSSLVPYPGTEFYEYCKKNNFIKATDWKEWVDAGEQSTVIEYPGLPKDKIIELTDKGLYGGFYFRPGVIFYHIKTTRSLSDFSRKFKGFVSLMDYWLKRKLKF